MRLLGYLLLAIGFGAINYKLITARDVIYRSTVRQSQIQRQEWASDPRNTEQLRLIRVANDTWDNSVPWLYKSAILILIGGVLLDIAGSRRSR